jgi:peptidoglycan/xylan/chitin deacetylase (PgdA/CDA1 family)
MQGIFTISLDFELHWGGFEKWPLRVTNSKSKVPVVSNRASANLKPEIRNYNEYFLNTRNVIPKMLTLFEKYNVHVTWATVGMLMHESKKELLDHAPAIRPTYETENLSAYHYIDQVGIGASEEDDPFHFASSLVKQIINTPHQELGTHTFSHFYCNEAGQTVDQFRADLQAAQRAAAKFNQRLTSLVFPRNQFNDAYLKVCYEEGITSVRSNPLDWFWKINSTQDEGMWKRLNRGMDAYLPIGTKNTYSLNAINVRESFPVCLPASRLLRPYNPKEFLLNEFKVQRIKNEMSRAAKNGEVYHLWWHPHNFGNYPEQSLKALEKILRHYSECRSKWNMQSMNMGEITNQLVK